ncbi:cell division control protein [Coprinopsis marcescibilis]|uniref:Cell division control protein n=1 Tax=Coprinopsis marcescibilis TaxID=230819 RepID=A0A5C3L7X6_COPMA|nr:cell division control protein [Coprinopsis marcescibilis]
MPADRSLIESVLETPGPASGNNGRKRMFTPGSASATGLRSHKKRRLSMASADYYLSADVGVAPWCARFSCENASKPSLDRFIPLRPEKMVPLTISPRTNRMCRKFGIGDAHRLMYRDETQAPLYSSPYGPSSSGLATKACDGTAYDLLRQSASTLLDAPKKVNQASVSQHLGRTSKFSMALDSPGLSTSVYSKPIDWSQRNQIAVACGKDIYYQDLDTKKVSYFFRAGSSGSAKEAKCVSEANYITWGDAAHDSYLACANDLGVLEVWDSEAPKAPVARVGAKTEKEPVLLLDTIDSICWNKHQLTWSNNTDVYAMDIRCKEEAKLFPDALSSGSRHRSNVVSMAWNPDGKYLATGDLDGVVHIWDSRAQKMLTEKGRHGKMRHRGPVKSLAWCPWKSELLATGSFYPEGSIRVWNLNAISNPLYAPERTISLNTAVHDIIWSPHCKEILSVHGMSFQAPPAAQRQPRFFGSQATNLGVSASAPPAVTSMMKKIEKPTIVETPLTNSILVHDYPTGKRLLTLPQAHRHAITASTLGPNGQDVFTASPKEQVIKMWQVWGRAPKVAKERPFARDLIR